jgi:hypothetical protein
MAVVIANREYEAWFLAAAESLRGVGGLPETLEPPSDPELPRDAKGWLTRQMSARETYDETQHQLEFSQRLDITAARAADSFDKLWRDMAGLLAGA